MVGLLLSVRAELLSLLEDMPGLVCSMHAICWIYRSLVHAISTVLHSSGLLQSARVHERKLQCIDHQKQKTIGHWSTRTMQKHSYYSV